MSATAVTRGAALAGAADRARDTVSARATENRRFPGFDGLRFIAAAAVVFSHAYLLATGSDEREPFVRLLGPGNIAGLYAVFTFFIVSGFLLSRSLHTNPNVPAFVVNRALRIYPGFAFCTLVTACLIGPLCTSLALRQYFASPDVLAFIRAGLVTIFEDPCLASLRTGATSCRRW